MLTKFFTQFSIPSFTYFFHPIFPLHFAPHFPQPPCPARFVQLNSYLTVLHNFPHYFLDTHFPPNFHWLGPLGRVSHRVLMSVCPSICVSVCLSVRSPYGFFQGLSLANTGHMTTSQASHCIAPLTWSFLLEKSEELLIHGVHCCWTLQTHCPF